MLMHLAQGTHINMCKLRVRMNRITYMQMKHVCRVQYAKDSNLHILNKHTRKKLNLNLRLYSAKNHNTTLIFFIYFSQHIQEAHILILFTILKCMFITKKIIEQITE